MVYNSNNNYSLFHITIVHGVYFYQVIVGGPHPGKFTPISKEHHEGIRHHPRCVQSCCCLNLVVPALEKNLSRNGPGSVIFCGLYHAIMDE